jgi:type III pantothenate kinase
MLATPDEMGAARPARVGDARRDSQQRDRRPFPARLAQSAASGACGGRQRRGEAARADRGTARAWRVTPEWLGASESACGVTNRYAQPAQLGADRWASLVAAWRRSTATDLFPPACVVVNAGTAVTIDVLDGEGIFRGGLILPGLRPMPRSLAEHVGPQVVPAGRVPPVSGQHRGRDLHRRAVQAVCGAIEQMRRQIDADPGHVRCYLAGGAAPEIGLHLDPPVEVIENLVLEGVLALAGEMK